MSHLTRRHGGQSRAPHVQPDPGPAPPIITGLPRAYLVNLCQRTATGLTSGRGRQRLTVRLDRVRSSGLDYLWHDPGGDGHISVTFAESAGATHIAVRGTGARPFRDALANLIQAADPIAPQGDAGPPP